MSRSRIFDDMIRAYFSGAQRLRLQSPQGNGSRDLFVDFQGSQSIPYVIVAADLRDGSAFGGVDTGLQVGAFLCSINDQQPGSQFSGAFEPNNTNLLGTQLFTVGGGTGVIAPSIASILYGGGLPIIIPKNGFLRFATYTAGASGFTPPPNGSSFQIDLTYFSFDPCECGD